LYQTPLFQPQHHPILMITVTLNLLLLIQPLPLLQLMLAPPYQQVMVLLLATVMVM
jgi:hypothetical protein